MVTRGWRTGFNTRTRECQGQEICTSLLRTCRLSRSGKLLLTLEGSGNWRVCKQDLTFQHRKKSRQISAFSLHILISKRDIELHSASMSFGVDTFIYETQNTYFQLLVSTKQRSELFPISNTLQGWVIKRSLSQSDASPAHLTPVVLPALSSLFLKAFNHVGFTARPPNLSHWSTTGKPVLTCVFASLNFWNST